MPFAITHKCNVTDPESTDYALIKGELDGKPMTKVQCPTCRDGFYILGHETFDAARVIERGDARSLKYQPGMAIPGRKEA